MLHAIATFFGMITKLFNLINRFINSADSLAESAEVQAAAFLDETKLNVRAKRAELEEKLKTAPKPTATSKDFDL